MKIDCCYSFSQAAKANKETIQPEVNLLLELKAEYKTLTGLDYGAPATSTVVVVEKSSSGPKKMPPNPENAAKKLAKKEERKGGLLNDNPTNVPMNTGQQKTDGSTNQPSMEEVTVVPSSQISNVSKTSATNNSQESIVTQPTFYSHPTDPISNLKCWLSASYYNYRMKLSKNLPVEGDQLPSLMIPYTANNSDNANINSISNTTTTSSQMDYLFTPKPKVIFGGNAIALYISLASHDINRGKSI